MYVVYILALIFVRAVECQVIKIQSLLKNEEICRNVTREPFFDNSKVIGVVWRVYFAWNMVLEERCMDIMLSAVTTSVIQRFQRKMQDYMEIEPKWMNATLYMTLNMTREMLLIPDDTFAFTGRFLGVPNIHRDNFIDSYKKRKVTLYKVAMKLLQEGRYLIISDCKNGVTSFLVRRDQKHTRGEIRGVLNNLTFSEDPGYSACKYYLKKKRRYQQ